jgi:hypothetical protein
MKKVLLTLFAAVVVMSASAQIGKGTILVGGSSNLGVNSIKPKDGDSETLFNLDAKAGYFFIDNLAAGINLSYAKLGDVSSVGIGAFGRYYVNGKIILGAGFTSFNDKDVDIFDGTEIKSSYNAFGVEAGYAIFVTDNFAIEPTINYNSISGDLEYSTLGLNVGFTLYIGR